MKYLLAYEEQYRSGKSCLFTLWLVDSEKEAIEFCTKQNKFFREEREESERNDQTFAGWKHLVIARPAKTFKYAQVSEFLLAEHTENGKGSLALNDRETK